MAAMLVSAVAIALPLITLAWLLLRRQPRAIFWFATAMIIVGSGYLAATGAAGDVYRAVFAKKIAGQPATGPRPGSVPQPSY
jgi:endonuclease/exonuclease/phosphatase (EEP) superfamily protein YafD